MKFPLGGQSKNFNSKKSRAEIINLIAEADKGGDYKAVRKAEGLTEFAVLGLQPVRSDPLVNAGFMYVVGGSTLYRVNLAGTVETLGVVGGSGRAKIKANSIPGDSQILVLNGSGAGYVYTNAAGLVAITDVDFFSSSSVTVLEERFWFARDGTNEFFGSDLSNGTSYNPLTFGSADESPDNVGAVVAKKSALWVLGSATCQYLQTFNDPTFPLRNVKGASKEWGILNVDTLAEINDFFAFFADDRTVQLVQGTQLIEISDLDFELKVKGDGTLANPGFAVVDDAYGFFVEGPVRSIYYLTFPTEGYTWGYDVKTGMSHQRSSEGLGYWRVSGSSKFGTKIICGDAITGQLWELDQSNRTENGGILRTTLVTPSISLPKNMTISLIELDMEVALTDDPNDDPTLIVQYTKDGGNNWISKAPISLGAYGNHRARVPLRQFGRLVRHKDFALKLITTGAFDVKYYGAEMDAEVSM